MSEYGIAPLDLGITTGLSKFLAGLSYDDLPPEAVDAARRGLLDWIGCALIGSTQTPVSILVQTLQSVGEAGRCTLMGRSTRLPALDAAMANGVAGHVLDFDDTHMQGVILHTSSPVLAALFALAELRPTSGQEFIVAYVAGFEAGVRTGRGAPAHHRGGWHLTGTLGAIAAAAACARLLRLPAEGMAHALGIGATQAAGMQQNRGTMSKSFHAGKAAHSGLLAALLAERGFDSSTEILEGKKGFCRIYSQVAEPEAILRDLGKPFEIVSNGFKPYACGVVMHPAIDAMIGLRKLSQEMPLQTEDIELLVNPLALSVTGVVDPSSGLQSKFSLLHSAAVAYLDGKAGVAQYSEERIASQDVHDLRARIYPVADAGLRNDQAIARTKGPGRRLQFAVEHATGTAANPMSSAALETKFRSNSGHVLSSSKMEEVMRSVAAFEGLADAASILSQCGLPQSSAL